MTLPTKEEVYKTLEARHGAELQKKLAQASVAVCGLGGLGSNIAISLARAGIGRLHLIDFDKVDLSNINRQQYALSQTGEFKTDALSQTLKAIAPYCLIKTHCVKITEENVTELLQDDCIICEAFDCAESKAMLVNAVLEKMPQKYIVAASGMAGLHSANSIKTRRVAQKLYVCGDGESDVAADGTLFASRVMLCAAHQAHAVLRIISGKYEV